jgi:hypothetical protein
MLRVRVEIVPHGEESQATDIAVVYIGNNGKGGRSIGHYDVYVSDPRGQPYPRHLRAGWIGYIPWFNRAREGRGRIKLASIALAYAICKGAFDE